MIKPSHLLFLFCSLAAVASADFVFPEKLGNYERGDRFNYEQPGLGYSVAYHGEESWITVYIYDLGYKEIPDGIQGKAVKDAINQAIAEVKGMAAQGSYADVEVLPAGQRFATLQSDFLMMKFEYIYQAQPGVKENVTSYVFCRGQNGQILKVRATGPSLADYQDDLLAFMLALRLENIQ